jgi:RND family efflux transporter MFP subunit
MSRWVTHFPLVVVSFLVVIGSACSRGHDTETTTTEGATVTGPTHVVTDTVIEDVFEASGTAEPIQQATLSTKLMGSVTRVHVREGDVVRAGQMLLEIDAQDLDAKRARVAAALGEAQAVHGEAELHAGRIQALYADSAAAKAQLDAAETGLARAVAGVQAARAAGAEVEAAAQYAQIRAPFGGVITRRFVDAGAFAAPGTPLVALENSSRLRVSATAPPSAVRELSRGATIQGALEGEPVDLRVEGVVPGPGANLYTVNAIVPNLNRKFLSRSAATLALVQGERRALAIPAAAVIREGALTGVHLRVGEKTELRWVRLGKRFGDWVEILSGLEAGDLVVLPVPIREVG